MLRNGPQGYGSLTKVLHWATVIVLAAQVVVGYLLDVDDSGNGRGRGRGRSGESGRGRGRGGDDFSLLDEIGDDVLLTVHVALGVSLLVLLVARVAWRRVGSLPPWADGLGPRERTLAHWTERVLLVTLFAMPATGLALVLGGYDDLVPLHVASHVVFFVTLTAHVGLVVKHQLLDRDRLLHRML